jgi:uncharacterized protein
MSESQSLSAAEILAAVSVGGRPLPAEALRQAGQRWPEVADQFLDALTRAMGTPPEKDMEVTSFAIYLAAQQRDTRAFPLLCALAHHPTRLEELIGDGVTEDLEAILIRTYDGDIARLKRVIEDAGADEYVREGVLSALVTLTVDGHIPRDAMRDYIAWLFENLQPRQEHLLWFGVQNAVAALGLVEFTPRALLLFEDGWVSETISSPKAFQGDVDRSSNSEDPAAEVFRHVRDRIEYLDDIVSYLGSWAYYREQADEDWGDDGPDGSRKFPQSLRDAALQDARSRFDDQPYVNPYRHVGRNDPCPCGSGKKFKKCCLATAGG